MSYPDQLPATLREIWKAATMPDEINLNNLNDLDLSNICEEIRKLPEPKDHRRCGILMSGVAIAYEQKMNLLYEEATRFQILNNIDDYISNNHGEADIPHDHHQDTDVTHDWEAIHFSQGSVEKITSTGATFPDGFEIGGFEMHLKRNIKSAEPIIHVASPIEAPPVPSKPMTESAPATPSSLTSQKVTPFTNIPVEKSKKLAALEASGASGYVLVLCPTVGTFRKGRTLEGKKQPALIKEGDVIKEGQTICYLDQFGTELPVKSDAAGEVIKILFSDGEAVGYGDPLIAVSP